MLLYHSVSDGDSVVDVPPPLFREQIGWLRDHYPVRSLDEVLAGPVSGETPVVITFDDGYRDFLTEAFAVLSRHGLPATVYLVTETLRDPSRGFSFAAGRGKRPLGADEVRELVASGLVTVGSHTHRHRRLVGCPEAILRSELETSAATLGELLGDEPLHFAYPWGRFDRAAEGVVRTLFRSAAIAGSRTNRLPLDPFRIARIPVKREGLEGFRRRVEGALFLEGVARAARDRLAGGLG